MLIMAVNLDPLDSLKPSIMEAVNNHQSTCLVIGENPEVQT